jgi:large subunit ribosomal protein L25
MASHPQLKAEPREKLGKKVGQLRRQGILPATVYGFGTQPMSIQLDAHEFGTVVRHAGRSQLIDLMIGNERPRAVFIREAQIDPKRNNVIHVEFFQPNLRTTMTTQIPVHVVGESPAVGEGGILLTVLDHLEIESLPDAVPANGIEVDAGAITEFNGAVHVADLTPPPGVTILTAGDEVVIKVNPPAAEDVVEDAIERTEPLPTELGGDQPQADAVPEA